MTNTFGVNILTRTAPASRGPAFPTGVLFLLAKQTTGGITTAPAFIQSIADAETAGITRAGETLALWDYLDVFFREGGNSVYVLNYATAGEAGIKAALEKFDKRLGPGQVAIVGEAPSAAMYKVVQEHCQERNRVGIMDVKETDTTKALLVTTGAFGTGLTLPERIGVFGSWLEAPPPVGVIGGATRKVPASCAVAACCQRVDETGNPNQPAGGLEFPLQYVSGVVFDPNDVERGEIFAAGVNTFRKLYGQIVNYGFVTPIAQSAVTPFWQLSASRARMWLIAEAEKIAQHYYMRDIDGSGKLASSFGSDLQALCKKLWDVGGLYGATTEQAYEVNVGVTVNREAEIAVGTLNAVVAAKFSLYAAQVNVTLVSVPLTGVV